MAGPIYLDRAQETTTTTGTGTYTLAGAVGGYQSFAGVGDGNTCYYAATDGTSWEVGLGTYTAAGTTLARTAVLASSNANAAVSWAAGSKTIWVDSPALFFTGLVTSAGAFAPTANDGKALGTLTLMWSDLFLAPGAVVNWNNGNVTLTHAAGALTVAGATTVSLGTSAAFTTGTIELGAASDTTISRDSAGVIAVEGVPLFSNIPQNSKSAAYTLVLTDAQKHILHPTADNNARTFTIPANSSVAYPIGTAVTFVNQINTVTIAITTDTMVLAGAGTTGSRTLAANGIATALKIASTTWMISGTGLT